MHTRAHTQLYTGHKRRELLRDPVVAAETASKVCGDGVWVRRGEERVHSLYVQSIIDVLKYRFCDQLVLLVLFNNHISFECYRWYLAIM